MRIALNSEELDGAGILIAGDAEELEALGEALIDSARDPELAGDKALEVGSILTPDGVEPVAVRRLGE